MQNNINAKSPLLFNLKRIYMELLNYTNKYKYDKI